MKVFYGLNNIQKLKNSVVALGVFDGVHKGHAVILSAAVSKARKIGSKAVVVTFYPHPQKEESLYSLKHRLKLISELGIDACVVIRFNKKFSHRTAGNFIKEVLSKKLSAKFIFVGNNFTFGKGGLGNVSTLSASQDECGFKLKVFPVEKINGKIISSTLIRSLIRGGKLNEAKRLLSRPVSILGTVIKGASVARKLGVRTANIDPHHEVLPPAGVYAVRVMLGKNKFSGVCSIGSKPTFSDNSMQHIEVHIFNFNKNIYGAYLVIEFVKLLRKQKKFPSVQLLAAQIKKDMILAQKSISRH